MTKIDVCVLTFRRPEFLKNTLGSIVQQHLGGFKIRVIVVDNDKEESARHVVEAFRNQVSFEVIYDVEPCQNISLARNRAMSHVKADYFAFIDDDEVAPADWLTTLMATLIKYRADVVFAPVCGVLPPNAPHWATTYFIRPRFLTGSPMIHGGTGNVLIRKAALGTPLQTFSPEFGLSGGEDTEFFDRLYRKNKKMVWCDEALVTECVPPNRLTIKWVCQRGFRSGQSYARIFVSRYHLPKKIGWGLLKCTQIFIELTLMLLSRCISYSLYVCYLVRVLKTLGQMSVISGRFLYEEYSEKK